MVSLYIGMTIRMNINELNLVQKGPSRIETIFMQIKEVVARYENLLILSLVITEVTSHYAASLNAQNTMKISLDLLQLFLHHLWI